MVTSSATIRNAYGIHVRPSAVIAKAAREFQSHISATSAKGDTADIKNLLELIGLGLTSGQTVTLKAEGGDEAAAAVRMVELFETQFDFER